MISIVTEEEPLDSFQGTTRTSNTVVKDVKEPLNDNDDDYIEDYMFTDDDINFLEDVSGDPIRIVPYPGPIDFGIWCESQFPHVIPQGKTDFLRQFDIMFEPDVYHWNNLKARNYLMFLGPKQYDNVRKILAELQTIRKYITSQLDKRHSNTFKRSYLHYISLRMLCSPFKLC